MRASTNEGVIRRVAPAGGVKSGKPVFISKNLCGVAQADAAEGEEFAMVVHSIHLPVEISGINADQPDGTLVVIKSDQTVVVGNPGATQAKLGVTMRAIESDDGAVQKVMVLIQGV